MFKKVILATAALLAVAVNADIRDFPSFDFSHANCALTATYPGQQCSQVFSGM